MFPSPIPNGVREAAAQRIPLGGSALASRCRTKAPAVKSATAIRNPSGMRAKPVFFKVKPLNRACNLHLDHGLGPNRRGEGYRRPWSMLKENGCVTQEASQRASRTEGKIVSERNPPSI